MATSSQNQSKSQPENRPELSVFYLDYPQSVSLKDLRLNIEIGGYDPEYLVDEPIPPDPQRPLSPFALRFGISNDPFWRLYHPDGRAHSALAPEFPDANGLPEGPLPKPSYEELGRLFSAERYQSWNLNSGPKTWQLPVLNEMLSFGGHIDGLNPPYFNNQYSQWKAFCEQFVRPDPDNWLSCFKPDHWFDLRSNILNSLRDPTPDIRETNTDKAWWSRDNKAVAYYLEIALEVASRVLRQLCSEQNEWLPWSEPSIETLPAPRWPLAWPSSTAVEWFNENTDASEIAVLLAEPNPAPQEYSQVYTAAFLGSQKELLDEIKKQVQMQREANPDPNTWANFTFTIPPYEPGWTSTTKFGGSIAMADQAIYYNYDSWHDLARGSSLFISPPSSPPPSTSGPGTSGPSSGGPVVATRGTMAQRRPAIPARRPYPRYFYISHVANHRSLDNAWVVEPDGGSGFNVFRITNLLKELGATEDDYRAVVITGPQGPTLRRGDQRAEVIRTRLNAIKPIGKLILLRRAEEVAECNGRNGQPAWVSVGPQIYDISNFPLQTSDIALGLPQSSGGPVPTAIVESDTRADELLRRLNPYLCAYLDVPQTARNMQYFTPRKLRWHDNPDIGIYIAVNNVVYDITSLENTDRNLYETLRNYCGVDTAAALTRGGAGAHALVTLIMEWKSLIVAGLAQTSLPDFPTGELRNYNNHRTTRGAFVVVDGFVYNTTHLMRYPDLYERALGPNWAGREITVPGLAQWLAANFDARRIARLVDGPAWKTPDLNVDPYKAYLARAAPPKYRT
ncbi:hypothetical protein Hte_001436 [Hypoxylon texense]